jgi:hypothetical protein
VFKSNISQLSCKQNQPIQLQTKSANSAVNKISQLSQNQPTQPKSANSAKISQLSQNQPTRLYQNQPTPHVVGDDDEKRGFGAHAPPPTFMSRLKQDVY